ncbi:5'-nucleotidase C-terminal domain-containing protein [Aureliella helgolandensis]|uniref:Bifunctional 2',3'-cyclic nucleotide 2'-phosphodiesterase/3'-nucleotidase protein n=1 Tax=Aureliella helgolandensis TaxID=2527968 RepID=A0A518G8C9_9BACT|nr:5'-nucleotidase C-terminal domain-containing protein [Aureliella helgolandensis]QDV24837.1 bifunctional 2',3'-cyclic nucleotide 2'-phosphodiesterase/3'-nucleotidase precursor protein [Aureliella helgolandensis]
MKLKLSATWSILLIVALMLSVQADERLADVDRKVRGPQDLSLTFRSDFDGTTVPYRLYLPSAYDGEQKLPLLVALHGTNGDSTKYFEHPEYGGGIYKREAEARGLAILCPSEGDPIGRPTEWRGVGELNVLAALQDVCQRFEIDRDRIVLTGQSMGGTGTTYLCCRYPDVFAGGIPLASTYGHLTLLENLRYVPMFYVQGSDDWPIYAQDGPLRIMKRLTQLDYEAELWMVPDVGHNTMAVSTPRVLDWALQQRLVKHPRHVTHRAYLPIHGRAHWLEIVSLQEIGPFAEIDAEVTGRQDIVVHRLRNIAQFILRPAPELLDLSADIQIRVPAAEATETIAVRCEPAEQVRLERKEDGRWMAAVEARDSVPFASTRFEKIARVTAIPTPQGEAETSLGSWTTDAIREATGTDIAIETGRHYRGLPVTVGQELDLFDLLNLIRPSNRALVRFTIDGAGLLEILEDNIRQQESFDGQFLVQVSGCRYAFDRSLPAGKRIVESDINPEQTYTISCTENLLSRGDMLHLAGRLGEIDYETLEPTNITAIWRYIAKHQGRVDAQVDGRIRDLGGSAPE